jgi:hypothetical protein
LPNQRAFLDPLDSREGRFAVTLSACAIAQVMERRGQLAGPKVKSQQHKLKLLMGAASGGVFVAMGAMTVAYGGNDIATVAPALADTPTSTTSGAPATTSTTTTTTSTSTTVNFPGAGGSTVQTTPPVGIGRLGNSTTSTMPPSTAPVPAAAPGPAGPPPFA